MEARARGCFYLRCCRLRQDRRRRRQPPLSAAQEPPHQTGRVQRLTCTGSHGLRRDKPSDAAHLGTRVWTLFRVPALVSAAGWTQEPDHQRANLLPVPVSEGSAHRCFHPLVSAGWSSLPAAPQEVKTMFCGKMADSHEHSVSSDVKLPPASAARGLRQTHVRSPFPGNAAELVKHVWTASAGFSWEKHPVIPTRRFHTKRGLTFRAPEVQFSSPESDLRPSLETWKFLHV